MEGVNLLGERMVREIGGSGSAVEGQERWPDGHENEWKSTDRSGDMRGSQAQDSGIGETP